MSKWKYYRRGGCSKWILGDSRVTKWDSEECFHVGIGQNIVKIYDTTPKAVRELVETVILEQAAQSEAV